MKKIKYDKYNHEINIENNTCKMTEILEKNKIYIEIISSIFLVIASITVSCASNQINEKTKKIYERQLEILENDREPYFLIKSEPVNGNYQGKDYNYTKKLYTIKNEGGLITGAYSFPVYTDIIIKIFNKGLGKRSTYILTYDGLFEDVDVENSSFLYDIESKTFKFYMRESDKFNDFIHNLRLELEKTFPASEEDSWMERIEITYDNKVEIGYINYKNIEFNQVYKINSYDRMVLISPEEESDEIISLGNASIEEDYRYIIQDVCKEIEESMKLKTNSLDSVRNPTYRSAEENKESALLDAKYYLSSPYSKARLIETLEKSEYIHDDAVYAADNCGADWNEQAVKTAENYLFFEPHSYIQLLEALTSIEKFTYDQAIYGINNCEVDWKYQAERRVQGYIQSNKSCSYNELIKLLEDEGYTHKQAVYGAEQNGYTK